MSVLSGLLAALCFPKFNLWFLAWVALVPLFLEIRRKETPRAAAWSGFWFGIVFFGINLFWINTLNEFAPVFAALGWFFLVAGESAFIAAACYLIKYFKAPYLFPFTSSLIWTLFEWLRTLGPFGVSAGDLGYTQAANLPLIQMSSITTVFGVSFLIVLVNAVIADIINKRKFILGFLVVLLISGFHLWGLSQIPQSPVPSPQSLDTLTISIIQGNIPQKQKMDARYNAENFKIHEDLTRSAFKQKPDIIIWPETTIFSYLLYDPVLLPKVRQLARDSGAYLIIGTPHYDNKGNIFNSVTAFSPSGEVIGRYDKQRLVPFGEYLPFRFISYPILKITRLFYEDFDFGPKEAKLLDLNKLKIGAVICFESTFTDLLRDRVRRGADLLLTVTNDAWFYDSSAPYEHFNCGIFRAIENRKYFIQAANTGFSGLIDPYGRIVARTGLNERGTLTFKIPLP